jgi:hypothetical protein
VAEKRCGSTVVPLAYSPINAAAKLDLISASPSVMPLAEGNPKLEIFTQARLGAQTRNAPFDFSLSVNALDRLIGMCMQVSASEINPFLSERIAITWYATGTHARAQTH